MAYLTLCGISIDVGVESGKRTWSDLSERRRSFSGALRATHTAQKRAWECTATPMSSDSADALSALLRGLGHTWRFSADAYSSKGLAAVDPTTPAYGQSDPFAGTNAVDLDIGDFLDWTPTGLDALTGDFTLLVRRYVSGWVHYVIRRVVRPTGITTDKWVDGVSNPGASTTFLTVNGSGVLRLASAGADNEKYSDLVALPFAIPDTWVAPLYSATRPFPDRPIVEVNGDLVSAPYGISSVTGLPVASPIAMRGRVDAEDPAPHADASGDQLDGRRLTFTLEEV